MYCSECGTKSKEGDIYCSECGNKLENKEPKKKIHFDIKSISKKNKIIAGVTAIIILCFITFFSVMSNITSPKVVAQHYMKIVADNNASKMYQYLDLKGDKTFVTKEIFKNLLKEDENQKIDTYRFTNISYSDDKKSAIATFVYTTKGNRTEKTARIPLVKDSSKKMLFFDHWKVDFSIGDNFILDNFNITVPKDSKVVYAGITVSDKYLDENKSTEKTDVYTLNQVFMNKTKIEIVFKNGYKIEDEVIPSNYRKNYIASISLDKISKEEQKKVVEVIKKDIGTIYQSAINDQSFDEVKASLDYIIDYEDSIKMSYDKLVEGLKNSINTLTAIDFTTITLSSVDLTEEGNLNFKVKVNYEYTVKYKTILGEENTKNSTSYNYMNFIYSIDDGTYHLIGIDNLKDYFSRY